MASPVLTFYRFPGLSDAARDTLTERMKKAGLQIESLESELCYYVELAKGVDPAKLGPSTKKGKTMQWLLAETFEPKIDPATPHHLVLLPARK